MIAGRLPVYCRMPEDEDCNKKVQPAQLPLGLLASSQPHHVEARTCWLPGQQIPHDPRSAGGCGHELLRQQRREEPLHHLRVRNKGSSQPSPLGRCGRHGDGYREEGEARIEEESDARRGGKAAQGVAAEGWCIHLLRRQRWRDREQQGRDEGFCYQRPGGERVRGLVAPYRQQRRLHCLRPQRVWLRQTVVMV